MSVVHAAAVAPDEDWEGELRVRVRGFGVVDCVVGEAWVGGVDLVDVR
jgi:hypothetical protein